MSLAANAVRPNLALEGGWVSVSNLDRLNGMPAASGGISGWRVGLSVSTPLLNRGDRGRALVARAEQEIEELHVLAIENSVRQDVRLTTRAIQMSRERLLISDDAAQLAARQLEAERHRLDLGLGDSFRVLQTEEYAVNAQLDAVRARYDVLRAQARHRLAAGTTTSSAP
jgi:outer membrane protein TolC